ncbi:RING finger protein unkempt homolog [Gadus chalcogrammus]|uniref:RING finger protein unkempt homolog n=1 Tax=Gadus chalcogrammus TaxID=1042646 RepID=UPI0024C4A9A7|nr:RING finger protein unkempt homolog [Gadus chalcogrammus]
MSKSHPQPPSSCPGCPTAAAAPSSVSSSPAGGSTSPANGLNVQPEKPQHYTYLKEFRTEQCPLFVQHKCTQHRPFACFHWHFLNQRRRRPIRRRDGTFNYSPDVYCTKYDEGTGSCPEGDECAFLHRTAGDTERRYHLRYYKTGSCIHETDGKGHCSKNGSHCAFAHGSHDLRSPVFDIREVQVIESQGGPGVPEGGGGGGGGGDGQSGQAASTALIEKILSEEPRWQDNTYVLSHYKTELCKKPPRLCRQGYACPYYHNSKDRRRSPHKHKYRALPCPAVKHSEEWGDPSKCEGAEGCQYCHTRTEQQFHPEIYKSTKCNDMQQSGSCPRGPFCAFAHIEKPFVPDTEPPFPGPGSPLPPRLPEPHHAAPDPLPAGSPTLGPGGPLGHRGDPGHAPSCLGLAFSPGTGGRGMAEQGLLGRVMAYCEEASGGGGGGGGGPTGEPLSPWGREGGYGRAPGFEREDQAKQMQRSFVLEQRNKQDLLVFLPVGSPLSLSSSMPSSLAATPPSPASLGAGLCSGMNANARPFYPPSDTVESVVESALDDLDLNDFGVSALERSLDCSSNLPSGGVMLGGSHLQSSAPVNIPGSLSSSAPFSSPSPSPPVRTHTSPFFSSHLSQLGQSESGYMGQSHGSLGLNGMSSSIWEHFPSGQGSPGTPPAAQTAEMSRLRQELEDTQRTLKSWDHSWRHTAQTWAALKADAEDSRARASRIAMETERGLQAEEEVQRQTSLLREALESLRSGEDPHLAVHQLQLLQRLPLEPALSLQAQLGSCLHTVEQALFRRQRPCCVSCGGPGAVHLPCAHGLQCDGCSGSAPCPLCPKQSPDQQLS